MNTPAHVVVNCLLLKPLTSSLGAPISDTAAALAVATGAILPDAPMFVFYLYQKIVGSTEQMIWGELYFRDSWQLFFDLFNSIPIALVLLGIGWLRGSPWMVLFAGSLCLHYLGDLPLHHDDSHRHFLPLTNWRFASPISYWDPKHYGLVFLPLELLATVGGALYLVMPGRGAAYRWVGGTTLGLFAFGIIAGLAVWLSGAGRQDPSAITASESATSTSSTP